MSRLTQNAFRTSSVMTPPCSKKCSALHPMCSPNPQFHRIRSYLRIPQTSWLMRKFSDQFLFKFRGQRRPPPLKHISSYRNPEPVPDNTASCVMHVVFSNNYFPFFLIFPLLVSMSRSLVNERISGVEMPLQALRQPKISTSDRS